MMMTTKVHDTGVVEIDPSNPRATVCGHCGRGWDDSVTTAYTPTPGGRCPFEYEHSYSYSDLAACELPELREFREEMDRLAEVDEL